MEPTGNIIKKILQASAKELGIILESINRDAFLDNDWNSYSVKASYSNLLYDIEVYGKETLLLQEYGNVTCKYTDSTTGEEFSYNVSQALSNLRVAKEFFVNPPIVENPCVDCVKVDIEKIDWKKPVYTFDEVKILLKVSDNVLRKWIKEGWISFTQIPGSDKRFFEQENLKKFLHHPKLFYPSYK